VVVSKYSQLMVEERTLKNSPKAELYGLHGLPLTNFWPS